MENIILYHGSKEIISTPTKFGGKIRNDYGQGFYCTQNLELAKEWACPELKDGYVNQYELNLQELTILNLNEEPYDILHWLTILIEHRIVSTGFLFANQAREWLIAHYHIDLNAYDIIRGYRADDSYFSFVRAFLNNSISIEQLKKAMHLGKLGEQYFLQSEKAFSQLTFKEATPVDGKEYYFKRISRDTLARKQFQDLTKELDLKGTFIRDLIIQEGE